MNLVVRFLSRDRRGMVSGKKWDSMSDMAFIPYRSVSHKAVRQCKSVAFEKEGFASQTTEERPKQGISCKFTSGLILTVRSRLVRPRHRKRRSKGGWMKAQQLRVGCPFRGPGFRSQDLHDSTTTCNSRSRRPDAL